MGTTFENTKPSTEGPSTKKVNLRDRVKDALQLEFRCSDELANRLIGSYLSGAPRNMTVLEIARFLVQCDKEAKLWKENNSETTG